MASGVAGGMAGVETGEQRAADSVVGQNLPVFMQYVAGDLCLVLLLGRHRRIHEFEKGAIGKLGRCPLLSVYSAGTYKKTIRLWGKFCVSIVVALVL